MTKLRTQRQPCVECPWRVDIAPGQFEADRFRSLAGTSHELSSHLFACHKSADGAELVCAGFLERGAAHNLSVRHAYATRRLDKLDRSGGLKLHESFRAMAVADGVDGDDDELALCRDA